MKIIDTKILDISADNILEAKLNLANSITHSVFPLFDDIYHAKNSEEKSLKETISDIKSHITNEKNEIIHKLKNLKKEQKVSNLLEKIEKLVSSGLINDTSLKREIVILLKILDKLPEEKIDEHLTKVMRLINKRFSNMA